MKLWLYTLDGLGLLDPDVARRELDYYGLWDDANRARNEQLYRSWFLGHFASGNHAAAPVLGKSAWRTAAGVRWPWRSTSQAWL